MGRAVRPVGTSSAGFRSRSFIHFDRTSPVAPVVRQIDRTVEFLDLVSACHSFVAAAGRTVPGLRDRQLGEDERAIVHENVARVRATLDWIETAVDTGKVDVDGELARLLAGPKPCPQAPGPGCSAARRHTPLHPLRGPPRRAAAGELTPSQVRAGLACLRDIIAGPALTPTELAEAA